MDLKKCRILLSAIDFKNLTRVAEEYGYTPSGICHMMDTLERELGFPLFIRTRSGVLPTSDCKKILPALRELLKWEERLNQLASEIRGLTTGNITIGTYPSISIQWLPEVIKAFQRDYPHIKIRTMEGLRQELQSWIDEQRVDLCFFTMRKPMKFDWIPLRDDPVVAVLPVDHPLANEKYYPLTRCKDEKFIMPALGNDEDITDILHNAGINPNIVFSTIENFAAIAMIECGLGMSIMNELITKGRQNKVVLLPLSPPKHISFGIALPSLKNASPACLKFVSYAKSMIPQM